MKRKVQLVVGFVISGLLVWLLFRSTDWGEVLESIRDANPVWLLLIQVPIWASFFTRVLRWKYIVRSAKPVPFRTLFTATQIGFLANFVLPFRAGELIRSLVLARRGQVHFSKAVALVAIDRLSDFVGLGACAAVTVLAFEIRDVTLPVGTFGNPEPIVVPAALAYAGGWSMGVALAAMVAVLAIIYLNQRLFTRVTDATVGRISPRIAGHIRTLVEQFSQGLHVFRSVTDMTLAAFWSLATWAFFVLGAWFAGMAFGLECPWYTWFLMTMLTALAVSLPQAPGFVGPYHMAVVVSLVMVPAGVLPNEAKALAIVLHLQNLFAVIVAGVISLMMEQVGLLELSKERTDAEVQLETATAAEQAK